MRRLLVRLLAWHIRTYGLWAYRHEPVSFAIYPVLAALGPIVVWLGIGLTPALWFLAFMELLTVVLISFGLRRRRIQRGSRR